jgi:hypothetical protein
MPVIDPWGIFRDTPIAQAANLILLGRRAATVSQPEPALAEVARAHR